MAIVGFIYKNILIGLLFIFMSVFITEQSANTTHNCYICSIKVKN